MKLSYHVMASPVGLLFLARTERGLRYLEFMDRKSLKRMIASHEKDQPDTTWEPSLLALKAYVDQLDQYFCGDRMEFTLPLDPIGSDFQIQVWRALKAIPYGETRSYGELARAIGQPRASRAVGLANHENPVAIAIPCHRVIGAGGTLVGYGGGLARKKWLLDHEARFAHPVGRTGDLFPSMSEPGPPPRAPAAVTARGVASRRAPHSAAKSAAPQVRTASSAAPQVRTPKSAAPQVRTAKSAAPQVRTARSPARPARAATRAPARRKRG